MKFRKNHIIMLVFAIFLLLTILSFTVLVSHSSQFTDEKLFSIETSIQLPYDDISSDLSGSRSLQISRNDSQYEGAFKDLQNRRKDYESTLKSCLGSYCMTEQFDLPADAKSSSASANKKQNNNKLERFGFLTPDPVQLSFLVKLLDEWKKMQKQDDSSSLSQLIVHSHVPPYGYGRNHGLTKIIRFVDNVILEAYRITVFKCRERFTLTKDINNEKEFVTAFEIHVRAPILFLLCSFYFCLHLDLCVRVFLISFKLRQLLRWNCRLNHVAAHTAMLTGIAFPLCFPFS
jgi:hypothetical protein